MFDFYRKEDDFMRTEEWDLTNFKLLPSAKPPMFHGNTVRKTVTDHLWRKKLRPAVLEQQGKNARFVDGSLRPGRK